MHPTGLPGQTPSHHCGQCAWYTPQGCHAATPYGEPAAQVSSDAVACGLFEAPVSCLDCGACCREAFDAVPVEPEDDAIRTHHPEWVDTASDGWQSIKRVPSPLGCGTRCIALTGSGTSDAPFNCVIYAHRATACRELEANSENCLLARRRIGLSDDPH